jgi:Flp pilus assembly pilin Flp
MDGFRTSIDARLFQRLSRRRYYPRLFMGERARSRVFVIAQKAEMSHEPFAKRLCRDRRGATAIEYGFLVALIALALTVTLPSISQNLKSIMVTAREGLKGKICRSDPTQDGTQCH